MKIENLKKIAVFRRLPPKTLESLGRLLHLQEFRKKAKITRDGDLERNAYFLLKGKVKIAHPQDDGKEIIFNILGEGEMFGVLAPLYENNRHSYVVALEDAVVGYVSGRDFYRILYDEPRLCHALSLYIGNRIIDMENRLRELVFHSVPQRVGRLLLRLSAQHGIQNGRGMLIDVALTQQEIANFIGATREATSSVLNQFKRKGWIEIRKQRILIVDSKKIAKFVNDSKV